MYVYKRLAPSVERCSVHSTVIPAANLTFVINTNSCQPYNGRAGLWQRSGFNKLNTRADPGGSVTKSRFPDRTDGRCLRSDISCTTPTGNKIGSLKVNSN